MPSEYSKHKHPQGRDEVKNLESVVDEVKILKKAVDNFTKMWMEDSGIKQVKTAATSANQQYSNLVGLFVEREVTTNRRWKIVGAIIAALSTLGGSFAGYRFVVAPPATAEIQTSDVKAAVQEKTDPIKTRVNQLEQKIQIVTDKTIEQDKLIVDSVERVEGLIRAAHPRESERLDRVPEPASITEIKDQQKEEARQKAREELWRKRGLPGGGP